MTEKRPSLEGDPNDPVAYLKEYVRGDVSHNPEKLAQAYLRLAEGSQGLEQLVYSALGWAVATSRGEHGLKARIRELERRIEALERGRGGS